MNTTFTVGEPVIVTGDLFKNERGTIAVIWDKAHGDMIGVKFNYSLPGVYPAPFYAHELKREQEAKA